MASGDTRKVILKNTDDEILIPYTEVASSTTAGRVKPDGTTTSVDANGAMSVVGKQDTLVSGTNIKTINGSSVLGSGDLSVTAQIAWGSISGTLSNQTDLQNALNAKQDALPSISDQSGKFLSNDGNVLQWGSIEAPTWGSITGTLSNQADLQNALNAKQGTLTFDSTPTSGSSNPVTSGGIYTALSAKANDSAVVKLTGNQTIAGVKTLSSSPILPTPATSDNSTKGATTAYVNNKLQVVSALPASPDANTFYFVTA